MNAGTLSLSCDAPSDKPRRCRRGGGEGESSIAPFTKSSCERVSVLALSFSSSSVIVGGFLAYIYSIVQSARDVAVSNFGCQTHLLAVRKPCIAIMGKGNGTISRPTPSLLSPLPLPPSRLITVRHRKLQVRLPPPLRK